MNVLLVPAKTETHNSQRESENKPNASPPANPVSAPRPLDPDPEKTITVKEAAYRLKKTDDTVLRWLRDGRLRGWQPGGNHCGVLVEKASVEEALLCEIRVAGKFGAA